MMRRLDTILFAVFLGVLNVPLFAGSFSESLIYLPEKVVQGQFYRLLTHPFVHISLYHLLLDGAAFLILYSQLEAKSIVRRTAYLLGIHTAVTVGVTASLGHINAIGYCGISGVAHGLMAIWCMERIFSVKTSPEQKTEQWVAGIVLLGLLAKCIYEVTAGHVAFESMHLGDVGVPVVASHLWGVIGAVLSFCLLNSQWLQRIFQTLKLKPLTLDNREIKNETKRMVNRSG
jgi:rhomboid family GlyGly-CTERM serine protease